MNKAIQNQSEKRQDLDIVLFAFASLCLLVPARFTIRLVFDYYISSSFFFFPFHKVVVAVSSRLLEHVACSYGRDLVYLRASCTQGPETSILCRCRPLLGCSLLIIGVRSRKNQQTKEYGLMVVWLRCWDYRVPV